MTCRWPLRLPICPLPFAPTCCTTTSRGTALPFEVVGALWLDGHALARALNQLALPGVRFRPTQFEP
ncbi:MAG: exo-beta-N-acetylmuramidase NamZ family protein, partial [Anaerolineae bacterium]